jgi:NitT/TauT family transport system substrate-binding protein
VKNPKDSVKIVLANDTTGAQTEKHQLRMMKEIAKLVGKNPKGTGWLDDAAAERTVETLMSGGSDPVITKKPEGAWTHAIIEKANAL